MSSMNSRSLLRRAHHELDLANEQPTAQEQFLGAHMAALKAAAAALAIGNPARQPRRRALRSAWEQLADLGEQWQPWIVYYEASARTRAALRSGLLASIESDQARETLRITGRFLTAVEELLNTYEGDFADLARAS